MEQEAPLKGIKVANFAWVGVGPLGVRYLSTWGATVVRVESHRRPDMCRRMLPYRDNIIHVDRQPWFADLNASMYGASIDMNNRSGLDIAWKLIEWADVMAESFTPGTMQKWGLDYPSVSKVKPDIIYVSTSQMGQSGPFTKFSGGGVHAAAIAGFTNLTGWPDRTPTPVATAFSDPLSARFVAISLLAALEYRRRTGQGQYLDVSQMEVSVQHLAPVIMDYMVNGHSMARNGDSLPYAVPHNVYPCKGDERWCAITVFNDEQWEALCDVVNGEWARDDRFSSLISRKNNEKELDTLIGEWTISRDAEEVEARLQAAGVPCHVVSNIKDFCNDPQIKHREFLPKLKHSVMGEHIYYSNGFKLSKAKGTWRAGPALGEHNEYVFKELLGMTDDEIADALIAGGITTDADLPEITPGM